MDALLRRWRSSYGDSPLHLLTLLGCFSLVGYVLSELGPVHLWNQHDWWKSIIVWFVGAVVVHDAILFPLYALANRSVAEAWTVVRGRLPEGKPVLQSLNYVRLPLMGSGLLLLVYFPGIFKRGPRSFRAATGLTQAPYLGRWLLLCAVMFVVSALAYAVRWRYVSRRELAPVHEP